MIKGYKITFKNIKDHIKIIKKKLFNLKKEKSLKHYKVIIAIKVFKIIALKKEILN